MKTKTFMNLVLSASMMFLTACTSDDQVLEDGKVDVTMNFSIYSMEPMTRAVEEITTYCTMLDIFISDNEGSTEHYARNKNMGSFNRVTVTLDKTKTYTVRALGHKYYNGVTMSDDYIISIPSNDVATDIFYYEYTFHPTELVSMSCVMNRIVASFKLNTTDEVPKTVTKFAFTVASYGMAYDGVAHTPCNAVSKRIVLSGGSNAAGNTATYGIFAIAPDEEAAYSIQVDALNAKDEVVQTRLFENVPLRAGYTTTYTGTFFTDVAGGYDGVFKIETAWGSINVAY